MHDNGWIKLHRKSLDGWIQSLPSGQYKVAITLIMMANWTKGTTFSGGKLITIRRGEVMTSLPKIAEATRTESIQTVRTTLKNLETCGFLTDRSTNRFRVISLTNYNSYQDIDDCTNMMTNRPATGQQQAANSDIRKEEGKKGRKTQPLPASAYVLADDIRSAVLANKPDHRLANASYWTEARRDSWAKVCYAVAHVDGRSHERSAELVQWLSGDQGGREPKYRVAVESPKAFREKWDKIDTAARPQGRSAPQRNYGKKYVVGEGCQ